MLGEGSSYVTQEQLKRMSSTAFVCNRLLYELLFLSFKERLVICHSSPYSSWYSNKDEVPLLKPEAENARDSAYDYKLLR